MRKKPVKVKPSPAVRLRASIPDYDRNILIDEREAAEITSIARGTLSRWRCAGKGPPWFKLEGLVRYNLSELLAWVESRKSSPVRID